MTALAFAQATVRLGGRDILSGADIQIEDGEFVGMLGANGAGKTTLMRAALGLIPLASGAVRVFGQAATRGHAMIGYLPQNRGAAPGSRLTGYDIVASAANGVRFGFAPLSIAMRREIDWALEQVGAQGLAKRSIGELSGGERQRLLLSQALIGRPRLLLLDEPLLSLDPAHQVAVIAIARRLCSDLGIAILLSAHELNPLVNAIDRVLYLGRGQAVIGKVDDVVTGPVLSKLYGTEIEVVTVGQRRFVLAGNVEVEGEAHRHEDHGHGHAHGHFHA